MGILNPFPGQSVQESIEVIFMFVVLIRTIVLYLLIVVGIRLMGKHQIGELEPSELVLALIIADLASVPMQDNGIPLMSGVIPIIVLLCLSTILSVLATKSLRFRALLCGRPSIVVKDGVVQEGELRRNRLTIDELMEELRGQGCTDLRSVKLAVLETGGKISVLPYAKDRPVTAGQMGVDAPETGIPVIIISDGQVLRHNLKGRGYEEEWLRKQLAEQGLSEPEEVFLLTVDESGETYCVPKKDGEARG